MKTLAKKLGQLRKAIEAERGPFTLYALVLPEDAIAWDILMAAKWIDENQSDALQYLVKQVQNVLTKRELLNLSGVLLFDSGEIHDGALSSVDSEDGWEENNVDFYGRQAQKVYVFVSPVFDFQISRSQ